MKKEKINEQIRLSGIKDKPITLNVKGSVFIFIILLFIIIVLFFLTVFAIAAFGIIAIASVIVMITVITVCVFVKNFSFIKQKARILSNIFHFDNSPKDE